MADAIRQAVISLSVEQKVQAVKAPPLTPIRKWRDAYKQAYRAVEKQAVSSERAIQRELDKTISKLQTIVSLQQRRAGGRPGRDPKTGRYTKRSGGAAGLVAGLAEDALGLSGYGGYGGPFGTVRDIYDTFMANRGRIASGGGRLLSAIGGGAVVGGAGLVAGTAAIGGGVAYAYYKDQEARALREGARLDSIAAGRRRRFGDEAAASYRQLGSVNRALGTNTQLALTGYDRDPAAQYEIYQQAVDKSRYVSGSALLNRAQTINGQLGPGAALPVTERATAVLQTIQANQQGALSSLRSYTNQRLQRNAGLIGGLQGAIANRERTTRVATAARNSLNGLQAGYLGADVFDRASLSNAANAGLRGAQTGDLQVALQYAGRQQADKIVGELAGRGRRTGVGGLLETLTGVGADVDLQEAKRAQEQALSDETALRKKTRYSLSPGSFDKTTEDTSSEELIRLFEKDRQAIEREFSKLNATLIEQLRKTTSDLQRLKDEANQQRQALQAQ